MDNVIYFNSLMIGITLITLIVAVIAFLVTFFYFVLRFVGRVSDLEKKQEAFQSSIAGYIQEALKNVPVSKNPGEERALRRDALLARLRANEISRAEAVELNDILVEERQAAQQRGDTATLVAIILGLALLASVLSRRG